jgi:hypothetical protein
LAVNYQLFLKKKYSTCLMTAAALLFSGKAIFPELSQVHDVHIKKKCDFRMILKAKSESMEG